jgi:hypothetical protein
VKTALGRLEKIDLREYWVREAADFTPWLAEPANLALLGETLDLDLESEDTEVRVGPFRADLLAKDGATGASDRLRLGYSESRALFEPLSIDVRR